MNKIVTGVVERIAVGRGFIEMGSGPIYYLLLKGNPVIELHKKGVFNFRDYSLIGLAAPGDSVSVEVDISNGIGRIDTFQNSTLEARLREYSEFVIEPEKPNY